MSAGSKIHHRSKLRRPQPTTLPESSVTSAPLVVSSAPPSPPHAPVLRGRGSLAIHWLSPDIPACVLAVGPPVLKQPSAPVLIGAKGPTDPSQMRRNYFTRRAVPLILCGITEYTNSICDKTLSERAFCLISRSAFLATSRMLHRPCWRSSWFGRIRRALSCFLLAEPSLLSSRHLTLQIALVEIKGWAKPHDLSERRPALM